jgi:hypothetical protein
MSNHSAKENARQCAQDGYTQDVYSNCHPRAGRSRYVRGTERVTPLSFCQVGHQRLPVGQLQRHRRNRKIPVSRPFDDLTVKSISILRCINGGLVADAAMESGLGLATSDFGPIHKPAAEHARSQLFGVVLAELCTPSISNIGTLHRLSAIEAP